MRPLLLRFLALLGLLGLGAALRPEALAAPAAPAQDDRGLVIAVVGSGVDYLHAALGGGGDAAAFAANDPEILETGSFPTEVVIGGWDFAGTHYSADCPALPPPDLLCSSQPRPDPDPLDGADGEGTRSASLAAGRPWGEWAGGLAPAARIVALKVLGEPIGVSATSRLYDEAIDWVLQHNAGRAVPGAPAGGERIDVILLPEAEAFGEGRIELEAVAERATRAGLSVIAPVGQSGGGPFSASGTAAPSAVLSVAAARLEAPSTWGIRLRYSDDQGQPVERDLEAVEGGDWLPQLAATGPIEGPVGWHGKACNDASGEPTPPVQAVDGRIALIERGDCSFVEKMVNAAAAGAVAVLMFTDDRPKIGPACGGGCPAPGIPGVMIDREPGLELQTWLEDGRSVTALLDADLRIVQSWLAGTLLERSSAGPVVAGGTAPDLAEAGVELAAAVAGSGQELAPWTGSAAAAARVAGTAGLAHELLRARGWRETSLDRAVVPALLASQARPDLRLERSDRGPVAPVSRQGSGRLPAEALTRTRAIAHPPTGHGIGFGVQRIDEPRQLHGSVIVRRLDAHPLRLMPVFVPTRPEQQAAIGYTVDSGRLLTLDDRNLAEQAVGLRLDPERLPAWDLAGGRALAEPEALRERVIDGHLRFQPVDASGEPIAQENVLTVPLELLPRPSSCVRAEPVPAPRAGEPTTLRFANRCGTPGRLRAMPLAAEDPQEIDTSLSEALRAIDFRALGIRYGTTTDPDGEPEEMLEFHVATAGLRATPIGTRIDLYLDLDRDGRFDRVLSTAAGSDLRDVPPELWYTTVSPLIPGTLEPDLASHLRDPIPLAYDLAEAVTVLRVRSSDLLLDFASGEESFDYGLRLSDTLELLPRESGLPGFDLAPDALEAGASFRFDQAAFECLIIEDALGEAAGGIDDDLPLSARGGRSDLQVARRADCRADPERVPDGLLLSYPDNATAVDQLLALPLWRGGALRPIFLPLGLQGAELR